MRIYTVSPRAEAPSRRTEASQQYRKTLAVRRMKEASQSARPLSNTHAIAAQSSFFKAIDQAGPTFSSERRLVQATPQQKWSKNADKNVTKLFPEISKSATSTTSLTSSSVPQEFEFLLEQKRPKSAAHQSYKSDRSGDQLSEPFHFDIEIVKNAANQSLLSFEGWEEDSNDSSSTLSTRSLRVGDEITGEFQKISFQKSQISRNNEDSGVLNDRRMRSAHNGIVANLRQRGRQIDSNGWNTPTFPEISQNEMKPNPETRNPTWTMFSSNTFQPIEKPAFPPKSATVVAVPKAKLANSHKSRRLASPTQLQVTKQRAPPLDQQNDLPLDSRPHLDDIKSIDTLSFATTPKQAHPHRRFQNESMETQPSDVRPDRALFHRKWSLVKPSLTVNRKAHREPHTTDLDGGSVSLQGSHDGTGKGRQISAMKTESKLASTTKSARYEHPLTDATTFLYQQPSRSQSPHKLEKVFERSIPELTHTAHKKQDTLLAEPTCAGPAALKPAIPSNASVLAKMLKKRSKLNCPSQPSQLDVPMTSIKSVNSPATCAKEVRKPTAESHVVTDHIEMSDELFIISVNSNPDLSKYARMIKVGLPLPIIKNAMQRDGVAPASQTESRNVLAKEPTNLIADEPIQRFRIHWESHSNVRSNTMWAMIGREDHWFVDISVDNEEMVSLFQKDRRPVSKQPPSENPSNGDSENGAKVVDSKRANNCGIILARIRLSYREIAIAIDSIDETALTFEQINGIMTFIPTEEESKGLKAIEDNARISGQPPFKVECEKFMAEIMYVDNAKQKIAAMSFMKRLPNCVEELKNDSRLIQKACEEAMNSSSLRKILGIVLYIGNHVNTSGMRGKDRVTAIQLSSLLKLQQAKTFDRKTSFLEYVVRILRRSSPGVLRLYRPEMPSLSRAANIQWAESVSELKALEENLAELRSMALQFGTENLQKQHPHQDHIYTEKETSVLHLSSLGQFVLRASLLITTVYAEIDAANIVFDQLVHYFGESPDPQTAKESSEAAPQILLYLSQFCADLDVAVDRAEEYEKARSRELRRGAYAAANLATISTETKEKTALSVSPSYASRGVVKARARPGRTTPTQFPIRSPVPTHYSRKV